jgi:prolipoprotein diacylglyceryltransferase
MIATSAVLVIIYFTFKRKYDYCKRICLVVSAYILVVFYLARICGTFVRKFDPKIQNNHTEDNLYIFSLLLVIAVCVYFAVIFKKYADMTV